jgi:hypothetical protein
MDTDGALTLESATASVLLLDILLCFTSEYLRANSNVTIDLTVYIICGEALRLETWLAN